MQEIRIYFKYKEKFNDKHYIPIYIYELTHWGSTMGQLVELLPDGARDLGSILPVCERFSC